MAGKQLTQVTSEAGIKGAVNSVGSMTKEEQDDLAAVERAMLEEDGLSQVGAVQGQVNVLSEDEWQKRQETIGMKEVQAGGYQLTEDGEKDGKRFDSPKYKGQEDLIGGVVTKKDGKNHYKGSLGEFDYNPKEWAIGTKTITQKNSDVKATVPVLRYIGKETNGDKIDIPDGVKKLDYAFEGSNVETVPDIPDSVESAHAAFMDCKKLVRAGKEAKEGEQTGKKEKTIGGILATVGGGVATGVATGAATGAFTGPGAIVTGIGGGIIGLGTGIYQIFKGHEHDGKGGDWVMSDTLKDASYMFAGCDKLTEAYKENGDDLLLTEGMYQDTKDMGSDDYANKNGSVSITNLEDSKISREAQEDMYTGSNVDVVHDDVLARNYSKDWDDETQTLNRQDVSVDEKKEVEDLSGRLNAEDVRKGEVVTELGSKTSGAADYVYKNTEQGYKMTQNPEDKNEGQGSIGSVGSLIDRGVVSFGEYKLLKLVTGSTLLSAGLTFGGQMLGILPTSMKPVLDGVVSLVGKDNPIGSALSKVSDMLPEESKSNHTKITGSNKSTDTHALESGDMGISSSMKDSLQAVSNDASLNINQTMNQNASRLAKDGVFLAIGQNGVNNADLNDLRQVTMLSGAGLESAVQGFVDKDGKMNKEGMQKLNTQYKNVFEGMQAYYNGAEKMLEQQYGKDSAEYQTSMQGLRLTMNTALEPFYQSLQEVEGQQKFMNADLKKTLDGVKMDGVPSYAEYQKGVSMQVQPNISAIQNEDDMYANAGLDEAMDTAGMDADKKDLQKSKQMSEKKTDEKKKAVDDKPDYGKLVEQRFGSMQQTESNDLEYE